MLAKLNLGPILVFSVHYGRNWFIKSTPGQCQHGRHPLEADLGDEFPRKTARIPGEANKHMYVNTYMLLWYCDIQISDLQNVYKDRLNC
jgi:hypothetical protein